MKLVLDFSTEPCRNTAEAAEQLRNLRRHVSDTAERRDLLIGSAAPTRSRSGRTSGSSPARATAT